MLRKFGKWSIFNLIFTFSILLFCKLNYVQIEQCFESMETEKFGTGRFLEFLENGIPKGPTIEPQMTTMRMVIII